MERNDETPDAEILDLGAVTSETKGPIAPLGDMIGLSFGAGLSED